MVQIISRNYGGCEHILIKFILRYINRNQSNRSEGDFDFYVKIDKSKEESKSKHSQSSEDLVETFKHKRATSNTRTEDKIVIKMNIIRDARKFELYKKKVFIIDVCLALINIPTRRVVIWTEHTSSMESWDRC